MSYQQDAITPGDYEVKKLPTGLNVLTILSMVWTVIQLIGTVWGFIGAKKNFDEKDKVLEQLKSPDMPKFAKSLIGDPDKFIISVTKNYENRIPILVLGLVAVALCFYGLLEMRKLRKQGFLLYTVGELLPFVGMAVFIGTFAITGTMAIVFIVISLLFIAIYASYRKVMVN
jgi:hypothetical protein